MLGEFEVRGPIGNYSYSRNTFPVTIKTYRPDQSQRGIFIVRPGMLAIILRFIGVLNQLKLLPRDVEASSVGENDFARGFCSLLRM